MAKKKKKELSPTERKHIEALIRRRQKIKVQMDLLYKSRTRTLPVRDTDGYRSNEDLLKTSEKAIDLCKRLGAPVPPKLTKILKDEEKRRAKIEDQLKVLEKEELSVQKEIDIIYGVNSGRCPLCNHEAPCPTSF